MQSIRKSSSIASTLLSSEPNVTSLVSLIAYSYTCSLPIIDFTSNTSSSVLCFLQLPSLRPYGLDSAKGDTDYGMECSGGVLRWLPTYLCASRSCISSANFPLSFELTKCELCRTELSSVLSRNAFLLDIFTMCLE